MDALINVAGNLVLPYLVLSLFVMLIVEMLSRLLHMRESILEDAIRRMIAEKDEAQVLSFWTHPLVESLSIEGRARVSYIPAELFAQVFVDRFGTTKSEQKEDTETTSDSNDTNRSAILRSLSVDPRPGGEMANIQQWFISVMDQASGIYRVRTFSMVAAVSTIIVLLANFDAIEIANHAVHKSVVQKAFEAEVTEIAKQLTPTEQATPPVANNTAAYNSSANDDTYAEKSPVPRETKSLEGLQAAEKISEHIAEQEMIFPVGWKHDWFIFFLNNKSLIIPKITGLVVSILALMIGAPFLFDLLNRYMVIRLAMKPFTKEI